MRSNARVGVDKDYEYVRSEIKRYKKLKEEKSVSLNEKKRLAEKAEADARTKARKAELTSREPDAGKVYEITLKLAGEPGLPEPMQKERKGEGEHLGSKLEGDGDAPVEGNPAAAQDPDGEVDEDKTVPVIDITMNEAKHILLDFVELTAKHDALVTADPGRN